MEKKSEIRKKPAEWQALKQINKKSNLHLGHIALF